MPRNPVRRKKTTVNPAFPIPEGVDEIVYDDSYQQSREDESETFFDTPVDNDDDGKPDVPDKFTIIKQTIQDAGNQQVVDVVAEVETVNGVVRYEYRLTKD